MPASTSSFVITRLRQAVDARRVAQRDEVEPAAAALAAGGRPELVSALEQVARRSRRRARSGTAPLRRASRRPSRRPRPRRSPSARRRRRRRPLRRPGWTTSRTDRCRGRCRAACPARPRIRPCSPCAQGLVAELGRVGDVGLEPVPVGDVLLGHRVQVERRVLGVRPQRLALRLERRHDLLAQDLLVEQVLDADAEARRLVGVAGADAPPRGADPELARALPRRPGRAARGRA